MACCVKNIRTKNYQNLIIGFKVSQKCQGMFFVTQCIIAATTVANVATTASCFNLPLFT